MERFFSDDASSSYLATPDKSSTMTDASAASLPSIDQLGSKDYETIGITECELLRTDLDIPAHTPLEYSSSSGDSHDGDFQNSEHWSSARRPAAAEDINHSGEVEYYEEEDNNESTPEHDKDEDDHESGPGYNEDEDGIVSTPEYDEDEDDNESTPKYDEDEDDNESTPEYDEDVDDNESTDEYDEDEAHCHLFKTKLWLKLLFNGRLMG